MLLDEILSGLRGPEARELMALIRPVRDEGMTAVVIVLHHGEKIAEGSPREVSTPPQVIGAYLGTTGG